MSGLLFHFCLVRNTHAEQRWYQYVAKDVRRQSEKLNPVLFFCCWIAEKQQNVENKSYLSK